MRASRVCVLWLAAASLLAASLLPVAGAHGLISLNVQVPPEEACPAGQTRCLAIVEPQPALHQGDHVDLFVWNDDDVAHRILVTVNASADPAHEDTSARGAIAEAQVPANSSRDAGSFTIPSDAEALYVWSDDAGHEAEGAWMQVPVNATDEAAKASPLGPVAAAGALAVVALAALGRRR